MPISLLGDQPFENTPSLEAKALRINLNANIYGTLAEIGAGQEVARHFFRCGGASGTIAKTMSAYDKNFSDAIYGKESDKRYVSESRLNKMLNLEMKHLEERIEKKTGSEKIFFTFANTVTTIDFAKKFKGHGWMGIKFQTEPNGPYSTITTHVRFHEIDARSQQESIGVMGVNLIYGAFYQHDRPRKMLRYLYDHIDKEAIEIDTINFTGPLFKEIDNRVLSLELVKNGMTEAVMFGPDGNNLLPARELYKKNILALRGSFRPVTKVNLDMYKKSLSIFEQEKGVDPEKTLVIFEITLSNLMSTGVIDEQDFMDRANLLCSLGHIVMISNFKEYYRLAEYFSNYTTKKIRLTMGVSNLVEIFHEKYYRNLSGGILEAFGKLFFKDLIVYLYPMLDPKTGEIINSNNLKVHPRVKELYKFFKYNNKVVDILDYSVEDMRIYSRDVLEMINRGKSGWEDMLPEGVSRLIKDQALFGYHAEPQKALD
ncbi:MAG: TonB-dependent receptor [Flavobacteriaceae bacterium]|nr:TonB-dependent receptor [Flavobacteriaceae bacterium]